MFIRINYVFDSLLLLLFTTKKKTKFNKLHPFLFFFSVNRYNYLIIVCVCVCVYLLDYIIMLLIKHHFCTKSSTSLTNYF